MAVTPADQRREPLEGHRVAGHPVEDGPVQLLGACGVHVALEPDVGGLHEGLHHGLSVGAELGLLFQKLGHLGVSPLDLTEPPQGPHRARSITGSQHVQ